MFGNRKPQQAAMFLKFYASVRLDISRMAQIKDGMRLLATV